MTLIQFRYIAAIADAGLNITVAARNVGATQSGLSRQLKQIEEELGAKLFVRRGKSLEAVTPIGREVLERARAILAEAAAIRSLAAGRKAEASRTLRIAASHTQARFVLPDALASLRTRFPDLRIDVFPSPESAALGRLAQGEAEVALVSSPAAPKTAGFAAPLYRWKLRAIAPERHPFAGRRTPLSLADLASVPLVTYDWGRDPSSAFAATFREKGLAPTVACTAADAELIKGYVRAGLGLGIVAEMAVTERDGDLVVLDLPAELPVRTAWALVRRDHLLRAPVLELLSTLAPHLDAQALRRGAAGEDIAGAEAPPWRAAARPGIAPRLRGAATG